MSLRHSVLSGIRWTAFSSVSINIFRVIQISVLARILSKKDFGIVAIVFIVIMFVKMFLDMGIGPAIIHKQNISIEELNSLYWVNIFIGVFFYLLIFFFAPIISKFYSIDTLTFYIRITAFSIILQSIGKQFFTLFEKELKFEIISKYQIIASFVGTSVSLVIALLGGGIYALILPSLVNSFVSSILFFLKGIKSFYLPKFNFDFQKTKYFLKFGFYLTSGRIINYLNSKFDEILIGKLLGDSDLGLYSVSKNLIQKPSAIINPIITKVTFPTLSKVQKDIEKLKDVYLKTIKYVATINFFLYTIIFLFSDLIVNIFLGARWHDASIVIRILSVYFMLRATGNPVGTLVLARGKPNYSLYWNFILFLLIPITIFISSSYGIIGISYAKVGLMFILMVPNWFFLVKKLCGARFFEYFRQIFIPLFLNIILTIFYFLIKYSLTIKGIYLLIIYLPISFLIFFIYNWFVNKDFVLTVFHLVKPMFRGNE